MYRSLYTDPAVTFHGLMALACTLAMRQPRRARVCASKALRAAVALRRPDLAFRANALLGAL